MYKSISFIQVLSLTHPLIVTFTELLNALAVMSAAFKLLLAEVVPAHDVFVGQCLAASALGNPLSNLIAIAPSSCV